MTVALCTSDGQLVRRMEVSEMRREFRIPVKRHVTFGGSTSPAITSAPMFPLVRRFQYAGMGWPQGGMGLQMTPDRIPIYIEDI